MKSRAFASAVTALVVALVALTAPARGLGNAPTDLCAGGGSIDPAQITVGIVVCSPGGGRGYLPGDRHAPSPVRYEYAPMTGTGPLDHWCSLDPWQIAPGGLPFGWSYLVHVIDAAMGAVLSTYVDCVPVRDPYDPRPPRPPVISPPTIGAIWGAVPLPEPPISTSPANEGVTGLETWYWSGGSRRVAIGVSIGAWRIVGVATLVEYRLNAGEGRTSTSAQAGSRDLPAARHTYERKGTYRVTIGAVWRATATMSGPGLTARPVDIGSAIVTSARDYPVSEVRSTLLP